MISPFLRKETQALVVSKYFLRRERTRGEVSLRKRKKSMGLLCRRRHCHRRRAKIGDQRVGGWIGLLCSFCSNLERSGFSDRGAVGAASNNGAEKVCAAR